MRVDTPLRYVYLPLKFTLIALEQLRSQPNDTYIPKSSKCNISISHGLTNLTQRSSTWSYINKLSMTRLRCSRQHIYKYYYSSGIDPRISLQVWLIRQHIYNGTTRAIRWAPEAHSCQVCRGTENAGHRRGVIHSGGRKEVLAENWLPMPSGAGLWCIAVSRSGWMTSDSCHAAAGVWRAVSAPWILPRATLQVADRAGGQTLAPPPTPGIVDGEPANQMGCPQTSVCSPDMR